MNSFQPSYIKLWEDGALEKRVINAYAHLSVCDVCALNCPVDRRLGKLGACHIGEKAKVSSYCPHYGEETPLSGWKGSGTIFFTRCNLRCQYCQNFDISQTDLGNELEPEEIASMMLDLQARGCHNINFVSPSHVVPQIISAVSFAARAGLHIPLVYNSGGYDSLSMLNLLDGIIDIYMPDMKYGDATLARKYSKIPRYDEINQAAVREMYRQVGDLRIDPNGLAVRGLLVRHLVLPVNIAGTDKVINFLASEISKNTYVNIMDQYRPSYKAHLYPELNRPITKQEYQTAVRIAIDAGLHRLDRYFDP